MPRKTEYVPSGRPMKLNTPDELVVVVALTGVASKAVPVTVIVTPEIPESTPSCVPFALKSRYTTPAMLELWIVAMPLAEVGKILR